MNKVMMSSYLSDRRGNMQWSSSLVWTCPKKRCEQRRPKSGGPDNTRYQTTRTPQEDMAPTDEGIHDGMSREEGQVQPLGDRGKAAKVSKVSIDEQL